MSLRVAIVTACFGGMDAPSEPDWHLAQTVRAGLVDSCDYISITEKNSPYPFSALDGRMKAKYIKLQTHKVPHAGLADYDILIWVDGNVQIKRSTFVTEMVSALEGPSRTGGYDIALRRHPERNCIYEEADFIVNGIREGDEYLIARYAGLPIREEVESYRKEGHPASAGLWWCGLFARRVNARMNSFFDAWWDQCLRWSCFDQNSFPYLARHFDIKIKEMDWGPYYDNDTYRIVPHLKMQ